MHTLSTTEISAQEARIIRTADSLCFDHTADGDGYIRAIFRDEHVEGTFTVRVESSRVNNYGPNGGPYTCFTMIHSARYDDVACTLARHIRKGSRIAFVWTRDNASPVTKEAGIFVDMLDVKVLNGSAWDTFRVATYIGYDNSARMVRRSR